MTDGVINVYKEKGMTSFGVVARLRRIFGIKKIGHTGTLDPDAEGVLPVCLGKATKLVDQLMKQGTKTYEAVLLLGKTTDTQDITGTVLSERPVSVDRERFTEVFLSFSGEQMQLPPMYSALKVNGKKLVNLARKGIEVERQARPVAFCDLAVLFFDPPRAGIRVTCSHGGYIRTLCHDIGEKLGCGACMESLLRTRAGAFDVSDALTLDEIENLKKEEDTAGRAAYSFIRRTDDFYRELSSVQVKTDSLKAVLNGSSFALTECRIEEESGGPGTGARSPAEGSRIRAYDEEGRFIGIYRIHHGRCLLEQFFANV